MRIDAIFADFDAAVSRNNLNDGNALSTRTLWREYFHNVVVRRLQDTQIQYRNLLWRMLDNWQQALLQAQEAPITDDTYIGQINAIIAEIGELLFFDPIQTLNPDNFILNVDALFPNPAA